VPLGDADRGRDALAVIEHEQPLERPCASRRRAAQIGVGEDHHELVAAVAGNAVKGAKLSHERLRDLTQHGISGLVSVAVVD
jgi:hypothetical protein